MLSLAEPQSHSDLGIIGDVVSVLLSAIAINL
jgi:hypothetical protein